MNLITFLWKLFGAVRKNDHKHIFRVNSLVNMNAMEIGVGRGEEWKMFLKSHQTSLLIEFFVGTYILPAKENKLSKKWRKNRSTKDFGLLFLWLTHTFAGE